MNKLKAIRKRYSSEMNLFGILIILFVIMSLLSPDKFFSLINIKTMASQMPEFGIMAIGMMVCILTGGINLSITYVASLSGIIAGLFLSNQFTVDNPLLGTIIAIVLCMLTAAITGLFNGSIIAYVGVAPMLLTLGTQTLFEGIGLNITKGGAISGLTEAFSFIGNGELIGIPFPLILYIVVLVVTYLLIERSAWGIEVLMIGSNEVATRFSGVNTKKALVKVYLYSSLMAGIAGILIASRYNSAKADYGSSYLMKSITAVVLGGVSISGGTGSVPGVIISVAIIQVLSTGLNVFGVNRNIVDVLTGVILIAVLGIKHFTKVREDKKKIKLRAAGMSN